VAEPSKLLLAEIDKKRKVCNAIVNSPDSSGDYLAPLWVHELLKNPEELKQYKDTFEKYHWRQ
jgi:hypothetical protein